MARDKYKTAGEFEAELAADPAFLRMRQEKLERSRAYAEMLAKAEAPLVKELNALGYGWVRSVWDFVNTSAPYDSAIPVLLAHLERPYPEKVLEGIGRALAVPGARQGWLTLSQLFRLNPDRKANGVKWGIAVAVAAAADDTVIHDVIAFVGDRSHGENRAALLPALVKSKNPGALQALEALVDDPEIGLEVKHQLRMKRRRR